jgi:hypothetical protein
MYEKYYTYGNIARHDGDNLTSSVRESIEWGYRDLKDNWRALDYNKLLRLKGMPVGKMMI